MNKKFLSRCLAIGMIAAAQFMSSCSKDSDEDSYKPIEGAVINQEEAKKGYMTMVSVKNDQEISLYIYAEEADRTDIWIDLNNNGKKDDGEADIDFTEKAIYSLGHPIITIYGKVILLDCYNNDLTKLDVSQNTNLKFLYCSDNQLTQLDVSKNTSLINLYCRNNQLTQLDVSKNTSLTELGCGGNELLTHLDVSKNTNLYYLSCKNNSFTNILDVVKTLPNYQGKGKGYIEIEESDAITKILKEKNWDYYSGVL